jgi:hypothetical protein
VPSDVDPCVPTDALIKPGLSLLALHRGGRLTDRPAYGHVSLPALLPPDGGVRLRRYTYQEPGEPKFALTPADGAAFTTLAGEAERLWDGARPVVG